MSDRITDRDGAKTPKSRIVPDFSQFQTRDSFSYSIPKVSPDAGEAARRISRQQLEKIGTTLSERDRRVIASIRKYRYLMSSQVQRLHFTGAVTPSAALRAASRCLKRLKELGLIDHLARRIGGVRAGSGALVWYITHAGERLLYLQDSSLTPSKRFFEPSPHFLAHSLAVAECAVQLTEICWTHKGASLAVLQSEPECWRIYSEYGAMQALKPDLFAITISGQYEDRWFIEVDLDTESPAKIIGKCEKYHKYYHSGLERQEAEVFPLTVWIVPTMARKEKLITSIREAFDKRPRLFTVITKDELEGLICYGGDKGTLC